MILGTDIEGESREVAREHARLVEAVRRDAHPAAAPCVLLSGGETTVTVRGQGVGGPNAEYALALALDLGGAPEVWAIACDTDGVDGAADTAGAIVRPDTLARARARGIDPVDALDDNDAHTFFAALCYDLVT